VRVVPAPGEEQALRDRVRSAVSSALGEVGAAPDVRVELVPEIEREPGPAAKVKLVRSEA
jgi:hypothetical protein